MRTVFAFYFFFSLALSAFANQNQVYIAYLGEKKYDDHQLTIESHHDLLATVVGSKEEASKLLVHNYKYGFSGFSAKLTKAQAKTLAGLPEVIHLTPDELYEPQGTRAPDYLGLNNHRLKNIIKRTNQGDGIIIGLIDTGNWGNNTRGIFNDEGYGPIPTKWKGKCVSQGSFDASQQCNKKIIGASWHRKGATAAQGFDPSDNIGEEDASPLDMHGHGTFCASTAAGSEVRNVTYLTQNYGTFRGIAPRARLAIYKVCYQVKDHSNNKKDDDCYASDVIEAFDQAIHDGVDVISASIGPHTKTANDVDNYLNFASYHAVAHGISVVTAAGNLGPKYGTMANTSPWHITVAAARVDEEIVASITLGNNVTVMSVPVSGLEELGFKKLVLLNSSDLHGWQFPTNNNTLTQLVKNNVVFLPDYKEESTNLHNLYMSATRLDIAALIVGVDPTTTLSYKFEENQDVIYMVEREVVEEIKEYARSSISPVVNIGKPVVNIGRAVRTKIVSYSSRGPSINTLTILKPDIAAPGSDLLGAASGRRSHGSLSDNGFMMMSGTSAATPVVAGLAALLKAAHPEWSPAAVKSALITTASNTDIYGAPIISPWSKNGIAGPLDLGGGIVSVNASDPGLIYDMQPLDYVNYLCAVGYGISDIKNITRDPFENCSNPKQAIMNVNLPSIGISGLVETLTIRRTVTNVGPKHSRYRAQISSPVGTKITVSPDVLWFNAQHKQITYWINVTKIQNLEINAYGSLIWTNGNHHVRSPIVVLS